MVREVWPYRRAPSSTLDFHAWLLSSDTKPEPLPMYLEGWDPLTDVLIERVIYCDVGALRAATGLHEPIPILVTVSWVNRQSYMAEGLYREPLSSEQTIRIALPSGRLGGTIQLITTVSVGSTDATRPLGTARWAGSVLASEEHTLVLEGGGPMFPIAAVNFASTKYAPDASWALQLPEDMMLPVLGSVLLLVNTRDTELNAALSAPKPNLREAALLDELETALGAYIIDQALSRRRELAAEDWPDQSVGALLLHYLNIGIQHDVPAAIATGDPAMIGAAIVGAARAEGFGRRLG